MKILKLLAILMLLGIVSSLLLGGRKEYSETTSTISAASTTTTAKIMTEDEKRQAENDKKIEEAQKEYLKSQPDKTTNLAEETTVLKPSENKSNNSDGLETQSMPMDFDKCLLTQKTMEETISPNYRTVHLVSTATLSVVRFCTNDGSVLSTCSAEDKKSVVIKSPHMDGC